MIDIHEEVLAYLKEENQKEPEEESLNQDESDKKDILQYARKYFLKVVDNREKNGALWVYHDKGNTKHSTKFMHLGMQYKAGRGWWIK